MHASTILYGLVFLQGAMATPVGAAGPGIEPRDEKKGGDTDCSTGGGDQQGIVCSSGTPFCCSPDGNGGQICESTNSCNSKVICCNNNNGYQICMGDVNFNMPITININMKKKKE